MFEQNHNECKLNNHDRGHINITITFILTLMKVQHGIFVVVS